MIVLTQVETSGYSLCATSGLPLIVRFFGRKGKQAATLELRHIQQVQDIGLLSCNPRNHSLSSNYREHFHDSMYSLLPLAHIHSR